jgi:hypothetical protein
MFQFCSRGERAKRVRTFYGDLHRIRYPEQSLTPFHLVQAQNSYFYAVSDWTNDMTAAQAIGIDGFGTYGHKSSLLMHMLTYHFQP